MWTALVFSGTAALFVSMTVAALNHQQSVRRLPARPAQPASDEADGSASARIRCSVIVATRNDGARLEGTVRRVLGQVGVALEVIVVDDRSADDTRQVIQRLASADSRVRTIHVASLPPGWLGKCHACHVGASAATGEWLLFVDADCWMTPDVIARALAVAGHDQADHIALTPGVTAGTILAKAWHLALLTRLSRRIAGVNRDRADAHFGMGAFNLVSAAAYGECGGYEALRLTIVDDMTLGLLLHRAGKRTRAFLGGPDVECLWGTTVGGMIGVMEKNYFAAAGFRIAPVVAIGVISVALFGAALVGPLTGTTAGAAAGLAPWSLALPAALLARRLGWPLRCAALAPLLYPVIVYAVVNSAVVTVRQGGVRWRDTFYPLDVLRKGNVR